jgi:diketogulonate reductase-like aldo/keto reductase
MCGEPGQDSRVEDRVKSVSLPDGKPIPALGLGTWRMGESRAARAAELAAVRSAIEIGYRLFDTAEMYGEGGAEEVLGQAIADALRAGDVRRDELFIVSKVYPHNASRKGTAAACTRSRRRLGLEHIDLYLLHWRGEHALADTVAALHELVQVGHIGAWGVSNFDIDDMQELATLAPDCAVNQVYFSLGQRGPGFSLLPWLREAAIPLMAYSPIDQGSLAQHKALSAIAAPLDLTAAQLALAWVLAQAGVVAIPKAVKPQHLRDNFAAAAAALSADVLRQLDALFPPPRRKTALAMT